jgi:dihydropteroate synthase
MPALQRIIKEVSIPVSIDTYKYEVAKEALDIGVEVINDVWGLKKEPRLAELAAERDVPIILVSNQRDNPCLNIMPQILSDLRRAVDMALKAGVVWGNILIDPGIGFGKTVEQNLEVLRRLDEVKVLGRPIVVGSSRKFFINLPPQSRLEATAATVAISIAKGADMVRVHDIDFMAKVCYMADAIVRR